MRHKRDTTEPQSLLELYEEDMRREIVVGNHVVPFDATLSGGMSEHLFYNEYNFFDHVPDNNHELRLGRDADTVHRPARVNTKRYERVRTK